MWVWSLSWEAPPEKEMATHSSILTWEIPWTEEPGRLQSTGSQKSRIWLKRLNNNNKASNKKLSKCLSVEDWINKLGYTALIEYYSAIKRNEFLINVTTKRKPLHWECNARVHNMIPFIGNLKTYKTNLQWQKAVRLPWARWQFGDWLEQGTFWDNESIFCLDRGVDYTSRRVCQNSLNYNS